MSLPAPFPVPSPSQQQRRGSATSTVSSASAHSLATLAGGEEGDDDDATLHSLHAYPPQRSGAKYRDNDDEAEEGEEGALLNEERDVESMRMARDEKQPPSKMQLARTRRTGLLVFGGVILVLLAAVPVLTWLSSGTSRRLMVNIRPDDSWLLSTPAHPRPPRVHAHKVPASTNDAAGKWGLAGAPTFNLDFAVQGWRDAAGVKAQLGVTVPEDKKLKLIGMDEVFNGTFGARRDSIAWCAEDPDVGVFSYIDPATSDIILEDVTHLRKNRTGKGEVAKGGGKVTYVRRQDVKDLHGQLLSWDRFLISPDMSKVLFFTDKHQQWRHSARSNVWLHHVQARTTEPLGGGPHYPPRIQTASWAPRGANGKTDAPLAYVMDNDLYVQVPDGKPLRVTSDGTAQVFNAVPDWVYEEEVVATDTTYWWSPSGTKLAYLRLDETAVPVYSFPIYNPSGGIAGQTTPYLSQIDMKYPKPGFPNPIVSAHVVDVARLASGTSAAEAKTELRSPPAARGSGAAEEAAVDAAMDDEHRLIAEVMWAGADELLLRETNRESDIARLVHFDLSRSAASGPSLVGGVVRREDTRKEPGWIAANQEKVALGGVDSTSYVDVLPDAAGFRHLAYFANATEHTPLFLTEGAWEIDRLVFADVKRHKAYFIAARPTPASRHLYVVDLPTRVVQGYKVKAPVALTDDKRPAWFDASFDPKGAYYLLSNNGPDVPSVRVRGIDDGAFELVLTDNSELRNTIARYARPTSVFYTIKTADGAEVSVHEMRPHDFDASGQTRYPVLLAPYGGPNSQVVKADWGMSDWHTFLASSLGYIVCKIDARGTGFRGRKYRTPVTGRLGSIEAEDMVGAMREMRRLPYVDEARTGIWGWSYGGYLTSKVLERDSGVFSLGMAVAPVSRWEFYDSIYTERYMKQPANNRQGYENASVHITDGFRHAQYLLAQGSGDDNVHFESSAHLLDMLHAAKIRNFSFRMFTDSAHSISTRGAYRELHEFLTRFLVAAWGPGGLRRFDGQAGHRVTRRALPASSQQREDEERQRRDIAAVREHAAQLRVRRESMVPGRAGRDP